MANTYADRVKETTTTTGTGTYDLDGAEAGHQTFVAGAGDTSTVYYVVEDGTDWEVGTGTVTDATPDTLSRDTIHASSNAGSAVNWGAGTKNVSLTIPARAAQYPARAIFSQQQTNGTGLASTSGSWQTYPINTEQSDPDGLASLSSNQITIPAGRYYIEGYVLVVEAGQLVTRLRNITDSTTAIVGSITRSVTGSGDYKTAPFKGSLDITSSKTFELQYYCTDSDVSGLGAPFSPLSGAGVDSVFGQIVIEKVID